MQGFKFTTNFTQNSYVLSHQTQLFLLNFLAVCKLPCNVFKLCLQYNCSKMFQYIRVCILK